MDTKTLIEARKQAEEAVAEMPESELRVEAFKLILNRLLAGNETIDSGGKHKPRGHSSEQSRTSSKPTKAEDQGDVIPRSIPARILALKAENFFSEERGIGEIREELQTHGWRYEVTALSGALMGFVQKRELRRSKVVDGKKATYKYFNP